MDFSLADLKKKPPGSGTDTPPDIGIAALVGGGH
jgi:hypothetical protein